MTVYGMFAGVILALVSTVSVAGSEEEIPVFFDMEPWERERLTTEIDAEFLTPEVLARLIEPEREFLGYIGSDYHRLHIGFTGIRPADDAGTRVLVSGYLRKDAVYCEVEGSVEFDRSHELKKLDYGVDNKYRHAGISRQGMVFGSFVLKTTGGENCAGTLQGRSRVTWMLMEDGSLGRNDVGNDRFLRGDNLYSGVWNRKSSDGPVDVNWGEYRIPFARPGLDIGAGEFSVNPKYLDHGWREL